MKNETGEFILYLAIGMFLWALICTPVYLLYKRQEAINRAVDITIRDIKHRIDVTTRLTKTETRLDSLESRVIQKLNVK